MENYPKVFPLHVKPAGAAWPAPARRGTAGQRLRCGALALALAWPALAAAEPAAGEDPLRGGLAAAATTLDRLEAFVREQDARMDAAQPIAGLDRVELEALQAFLDRAARALPPDDAEWADLSTRFQNATRADARLRAALAPDTRLRPDAYAGADAAELKRAAEDAVLAVHPEAVLLRAILAAPNWTDEAPASPQAVAGRRLPAEVAARILSTTKLFLVELRQERAPTGEWGPTQAAPWHAIPMLEENAR